MHRGRVSKIAAVLAAIAGASCANEPTMPRFGAAPVVPPSQFLDSANSVSRAHAIVAAGVARSRADSLAQWMAARGDSSYLLSLLRGRQANEALIASRLRAAVAPPPSIRGPSFVEVTDGAVIDFATWPDPAVSLATTSFSFSGSNALLTTTATYSGNVVHFRTTYHTTISNPSLQAIPTTTSEGDEIPNLDAQIQCIVNNPSTAATTCGVAAYDNYSEFQAATLQLGQSCGSTAFGGTVAKSTWNFPILGAAIDLLNSAIPWKIPQPSFKTSPDYVEAPKTKTNGECPPPRARHLFSYNGQSGTSLEIHVPSGVAPTIQLNGGASGPGIDGGPAIASYSWLVGGNTGYSGPVNSVTLASPTHVDFTVTDAEGRTAESSGDINIIPDDPCEGPWDCGDPNAGKMVATSGEESSTTSEIPNPPPGGPWHITCYYTTTFEITVYHIAGNPVVANITQLGTELDYCVSY
jgi:hypothetical protein